MDIAAKIAPKVFVSYARQDCGTLAEELVTALKLLQFEGYLDRSDIAAGEDWEHRLADRSRPTPNRPASWRWTVARIATRPTLAPCCGNCSRPTSRCGWRSPRRRPRSRKPPTAVSGRSFRPT